MVEVAHSVIDTLLECRISELCHQHFVLARRHTIPRGNHFALAFPNPLALLGGLAVL